MTGGEQVRRSVGKLIEAAEQFIEVADLGPSTEAYDEALRKLQAASKAASETPEVPNVE